MKARFYNTQPRTDPRLLPIYVLFFNFPSGDPAEIYIALFFALEQVGQSSRFSSQVCAIHMCVCFTFMFWLNVYFGRRLLIWWVMVLSMQLING